MTLSDSQGGRDNETATAFVVGAGVNENILQIVGTPNADRVTINQQGNGFLKVHASFFDGRSFRRFPLEDVGGILATVGAGDDRVTMAGNISLPAILDGGDGNDHLNGGRGANVLLGGTGNDRLLGGSGRDILIGGYGGDNINGGPGEDILISGATSFDADYATLKTVMAEWSSERAYDVRILNLSGRGVGTRLNDEVFLQLDDTVTDDEDGDLLEGSSGLDWYFSNLDDDRNSSRLDEVLANDPCRIWEP